MPRDDGPSARELRRSLTELARDDRVRPLLDALRQHDPASFEHCRRVGLACLDAAHDLYACPAERLNLGRAGLLHDIGKAGLPVALLRKPTPLSDVERGRVRSHPQLGFEALRGFDHEPTRLAVLMHHQFGPHPYPDEPHSVPEGAWSETDARLGREMAQVVAVLDVIDALASRRAYREALSTETITTILEREYTGDPAFVELALRRRAARASD